MSRTSGSGRTSPREGWARRRLEAGGCATERHQRRSAFDRARRTRVPGSGIVALPSSQPVVLAPGANPRSSLDIGRRLALRSMAVQTGDVVADAQSAEPVQCLGRGSSGPVGGGLGSRAGASRPCSQSGTDRGHRCRSRHRRAEHPSCQETGLLPNSGRAGFSPGTSGGRAAVPGTQRRLTHICRTAWTSIAGGRDPSRSDGAPTAPTRRVGHSPVDASASKISSKESDDSGRIGQNWTDTQAAQSAYHDTMIDHDDLVGDPSIFLDEHGSPTTRSSCTPRTTGRT